MNYKERDHNRRTSVACSIPLGHFRTDNNTIGKSYSSQKTSFPDQVDVEEHCNELCPMIRV
jgi:hypothetical protein